MKTSTNFSPEVRERGFAWCESIEAMYESQWAAICSIVTKIGCTAETLRRWVRQAATWALDDEAVRALTGVSSTARP